MAENKTRIRKEIKDMLASSKSEELEIQSEKICTSFLQSNLYKQSELILSYMPMSKEASPLAITKTALQDGKTVALPRVVPFTSNMDFYIIQKDCGLLSQLKRGSWNILEPNENCVNVFPFIESFKKITVIVPGLAFTKEGNRLGHGKGYYDIYISRLLKKIEESGSFLTLAGICFDFQIVSSIPCEAHDIQMQVVIAPYKTYSAKE